MRFPTEQFEILCLENGIPLEGAVLQQFAAYAEFLVEYNQKVNLTAITEPWEIAVKHFWDSLLLLKAVSPGQGAKLADVGTGAGFPGVPLKLARPDLQLTLLDSLNKRVVFLQQLAEKLDFSAEMVHMRAEEAGRAPHFREQFDLVTARAVAALPLLCEYCLPLVRVGGQFVAMKARSVQEELKASEKALKLLGGEIEDVHALTLPEGEERVLVVVKKISQCPPKYPRPTAQMAKRPL